MARNRARLLELIVEQALTFGERTLTSGAQSTYYIDGKMITLSAEGGRLVAEELLARIEGAGINSVGGPMIGADPMATALIQLAFDRGMPLRAFIVRKEAKTHGMQKYIEGPFESGDRVAILDDVVTRGGSLLQAIEAVRDAGADVAKVLAIVDRQEGGRENIRKATGLDVEAIFTRDELLTAARATH